MKAHTLDVYPDEMIVMTLLLGQFIERQLAELREAPDLTPDRVHQIRVRIEIASRLRGKLPLVIDHESNEQ